jgi:hypothetical protein
VSFGEEVFGSATVTFYPQLSVSVLETAIPSAQQKQPISETAKTDAGKKRKRELRLSW